MSRPQRSRRVCRAPRVDAFVPVGSCREDPIFLTLDEYEVVRLVDLERRTHEQCAEQMDISRSTAQEIYENARGKIAACLVYGKKLIVSGGNYRICGGKECGACGRCCPTAPQNCHNCKSERKGESKMKIAVTYENGQVFQRFGHTEQFKIYDVADGKIVGSEVVNTDGVGHGALADFLMRRGVDTVICGGLGGCAKTALKEAGIQYYGGVVGDADEAAAALAEGNLAYDPNARCNCGSHEGNEHGGCRREDSQGEHTCGGHGHGCGCGRHGRS